MRKARVVLLATLFLTTYWEGRAVARRIVDSTPMTDAWSNNIMVMTSIADDGTLWAIISAPDQSPLEMVDPAMLMSFTTRMSWIQLPPLPGGRYPYRVFPVNYYVTFTGSIYTMCLATDGTIWALTPMLSDIFRSTTWYYGTFNPEWIVFAPPLPEESTPDAGAVD
jgi:hypothetical protein